ncbi:heterokaryon incompatibility [Fusarium albosuccineum]|uniref:Heterokaryon incompatibility n=1 Tax=Fusarium albosuccineum TaxID=1237068 RepID=A0A8H4KZQ5_9HYPO|nr:heterokaryon incompatibility [Fusarium albosuccineum]
MWSPGLIWTLFSVALVRLRLAQSSASGSGFCFGIVPMCFRWPLAAPGLTALVQCHSDPVYVAQEVGLGIRCPRQWLLGRLPADTCYTPRLVCIWACFCLLLLPGRISLGMPIIDWFIWYSVFLAVFSSGYWGIIGGLGFCALSAGLVLLVRPNNGSSWRFVLFSVALNFLSRMIHLFFCVFYVPDFATILAPSLQLPFRVFMGKYVHVSERDDSRSNLCQSCLQWTAASKLIVPAGRVTLRIVEWHPLGQGLSVGSGSSDSGWPCHLCTLLWHLVDRHGEQTSGSAVSSTSHEQWEVKIWAEDINPPCLHLHQASADSDLHIELAREWLTSCQECHALCNSPRATPDSLPSRLLAIRAPAPGNATPTVRVVQVSSPSCADGAIVYCALSHSWGGSATLRLIKTNQKELTEGVDVKQLSNNIRDAILITHRLGYQYIWVDSLCIVQDDDADWKREAAKMGDIYAGAILTIAATGAESGDQGCFRQRNTDLLTPCELAASSKGHLLPDRIYAVPDDLTDFRDGVDDGPLNHRGRVLQERLLSRRILHYGERMIYWECAYPDGFYGNFIAATEVEPLVAPRNLLQRLLMIGQQMTPPPDATGQDRLVWRAETDSFWKEMRRRIYTGWGDDGDRDNNSSNGANDGLPVNRFRTALERLLATKPAAAPDYGFLSYSACWYTIVEAYTRSQLTFSADRFVAISSMVKRIQQSTGRVYAAGLCEDSLVTDIVWFVPGTPGARVYETLSPRQKETLRDAQRPSTATPMAPTWSWMSVDAAVSIDLLASNADIIFRGKSLITACSVSVKDVDTDSRSKVFNAVESTLIAEGPLLP